MEHGTATFAVFDSLSPHEPCYRGIGGKLLNTLGKTEQVVADQFDGFGWRYINLHSFVGPDKSVGPSKTWQHLLNTDVTADKKQLHLTANNIAISLTQPNRP